MRSIRVLLVTFALGVWLALATALPAGAVVCHDYPGGCCEDVTVLGKTIIHIDC